jgi:hypothetical protein
MLTSNRGDGYSRMEIDPECKECNGTGWVDIPCNCGSGKPCWMLTDARGIPCGYVCEDCEKAKKAQYRPDVFEDPQYWTDEPVEPEEPIVTERDPYFGDM